MRKLAAAAVVAYTLLYLAFIVGVLYIAAHFITKYW